MFASLKGGLYVENKSYSLIMWRSRMLLASHRHLKEALKQSPSNSTGRNETEYLPFGVLWFLSAVDNR